MSDNKNAIGELAWIDLSVSNAGEVKDFYQTVIGWQNDEINMGEYNDYAMKTPDTHETISGICHATGVNKDLPAAWLPYFLVADVEQSAKQTIENGGKLITSIKTMGDDRYVVIQDPAGAVCALYQKGNH